MNFRSQTLQHLPLPVSDWLRTDLSSEPPLACFFEDSWAEIVDDDGLVFLLLDVEETRSECFLLGIIGLSIDLNFLVL